MKYKIDDKGYEVIIIKKNNKNTYIRVKDDLTINVTTNYFVTNNQITKILNQNYDYLKKSIERCVKHNEKSQKFYYLGNCYDIITISTKDIEIIDNRIYVKSIDYLNKWLQKEIKQIYKQHLNEIYNLFEENIPYPSLKIRRMKTRWGVCNKKTKTVTLNSELIRYSLDKLDYVIVHELAHFIYFNHSSSFWSLVSKYCPDYKKIRKELKD